MGDTGAAVEGAGDGALISVRVAGAWAGILRISTRWSGSELRAEAARCSGFAPETINLIAAGRNLKDSDCLAQLRLHENSKLLMTRVGTQLATPIIQEAERVDRLERIRAAAEAMASKADGRYLSLDQYDISLQNQNGEALRFDSESSKKAVLMGLLLHGKARKLIKESKYEDGLEVLKYAEESFELCDGRQLEHVDNVAFMQIDMVWCLFMLRDIGGLGVAKERLKKARDGLKRAHGPNLERLRVLQGGFRSELAIYVRLELLEGVIAYHSGLIDASKEKLVAAQSKYNQLQVSDESLALLAGMGFDPKESTRALRVSGQDVDRAVSFVMEQRDVKEKKRKEDEEHLKNRREQNRYGKTKSGRALDLRQLNALVSLGYEKVIVTEALKQTDNDTNAALDVLSNPENLVALQVSLSSVKRSRRTVSDSDLNELIQMGFARDKAKRALESTSSLQEALEKLVSDNNASSSSSSNPSREEVENEAGGDKDDVEAEDDIANKDDVEAEDDIAKDITGDAYEEYDIEVDLEGEAIARYLSLVAS